ncbi:MAG: YceI family protein [Crocinitomicaceae bacterium]|nr:YceI family protein [Crocinitomicaceae bacterium]
MKKFGIFFMAAGALSLAACTESTTDETVDEEVVTYSLDAGNSSIGWKGSISDDYFHAGTVDFKSGSVSMENGELTEGSFVIDMTTIDDTSLEDPKSDYLAGHLQGTMVDEDHPQNLFFNTPDFPSVEVKLGEYKDGNLSTTLMILGSELTQDVAVELSSDENGASIKGNFTMDFSSLGIPGLSQEGEGAISPEIVFDLNVMLTK